MPHDIENHSHSLLPSEPELKVKAIESALVNQGLIDPAALDEIIDTYQNKIGPKNGASIIAKAWIDQDFKDESNLCVAEINTRSSCFDSKSFN